MIELINRISPKIEEIYIFKDFNESVCDSIVRDFRGSLLEKLQSGLDDVCGVDDGGRDGPRCAAANKRPPEMV